MNDIDYINSYAPVRLSITLPLFAEMTNEEQKENLSLTPYSLTGSSIVSGEEVMVVANVIRKFFESQ